jgi:hypothetical protein
VSSRTPSFYHSNSSPTPSASHCCPPSHTPYTSVLALSLGDRLAILVTLYSAIVVGVLLSLQSFLHFIFGPTAMSPQLLKASSPDALTMVLPLVVKTPSPVRRRDDCDGGHGGGRGAGGRGTGVGAASPSLTRSVTRAAGAVISAISDSLRGHLTPHTPYSPLTLRDDDAGGSGSSGGCGGGGVGARALASVGGAYADAQARAAGSGGGSDSPESVLDVVGSCAVSRAGDGASLLLSDISQRSLAPALSVDHDIEASCTRMLHFHHDDHASDVVDAAWESESPDSVQGDTGRRARPVLRRSDAVDHSDCLSRDGSHLELRDSGDTVAALGVCNVSDIVANSPAGDCSRCAASLPRDCSRHALSLQRPPAPSGGAECQPQCTSRACQGGSVVCVLSPASHGERWADSTDTSTSGSLHGNASQLLDSQ